jgi:hypothetical protein
MNIFKKKPTNTDKLLDEFWITYYFALIIEKPKEKNTTEFKNYLEEINIELMNKILMATIGLTEIKKSISIKTYKFSELPREYSRPFDYVKTSNNTYILLIRFPSITEEESKYGFKGKNKIFRIVKEKQNYKCSPNQSIKIKNILGNIELNLCVFYKLKQSDQIINTIHGINNEIIATTHDSILYYTYPMSKRIELYKHNLKIENNIFFGSNFKDAVNSIRNMKNESEFAKRNVKRLENLIKKYNLKL